MNITNNKPVGGGMITSECFVMLLGNNDMRHQFIGKMIIGIIGMGGVWVLGMGGVWVRGRCGVWERNRGWECGSDMQAKGRENINTQIYEYLMYYVGIGIGLGAE